MVELVWDWQIIPSLSLGRHGLGRIAWEHYKGRDMMDCRVI